MNIKEELSRIQKELKAPKNQYNSYGGYSYRSCEDIMTAVKPLLDDCILTITDDIVSLDGRFYVKATATLANSQGEISTSAFARETETKKGMDASQITGSASSYARKYALNGLFLIDDVKDADTTNKHGHEGEEKLKDWQKKSFREWILNRGVTIETIEKEFGPIEDMTLDIYGKACKYIKEL